MILQKELEALAQNKRSYACAPVMIAGIEFIAVVSIGEMAQELLNAQKRIQELEYSQEKEKINERERNQ